MRQFFFLILISLLATSSALAQSGRRGATKPTTTTAPSVSGPKEIENKPKPQPKFQILIGITGRSVFTNVPYYLYDTVLENCIRRLGEAEIVFPTSAGHDMNRSDAIKAAKQETVRYVVLLEMGSEFADAGRSSSNSNNQDDLYVAYTIFEPETGKLKRAGRTHQHIYQTGRGGVTTPSKNSPVYSEYALRQAAREAADKILASFDIKVRESPF
jgi:hypothetical protein